MEINETAAEEMNRVEMKKVDMNKVETDQSNVINPVKLEEFKRRLEKEQNLMLAGIAGVVACILSAAIWAIVTVATKYQIGWMAVGVGFLVGYAVRFFGRGTSETFGVIGAVCALSGCVLGNLLSSCGFLASQESIPLFQVIVNTLLQPAFCVQLLQITFNPIDLLFYGLAIYEGYRFSFRQVRQEELSELVTQE